MNSKVKCGCPALSSDAFFWTINLELPLSKLKCMGLEFNLKNSSRLCLGVVHYLSEKEDREYSVLFVIKNYCHLRKISGI